MKRIIRCVVLYYETGKSGKDYREKENHRDSFMESINLKQLEEAVR